jgi:hypothetical protein
VNDRETPEQPQLPEHERSEEAQRTTPQRKRYEPPKLMKKRSVARVTLFSGGGVAAAGLTANG